MAVGWLFVDGVGIGRHDPSVNPLAVRPGLLSAFEDGAGGPLPSGAVRTALDACLGVEGRPQSATGQATLYTGVNAPAALGSHLVGLPNAALTALLKRESLFLKARERGVHATFANAYPAPYLEALGLPYEGPRAVAWEIPRNRRLRARPSASTLAVSAAGPLRTLAQAEAGEALTHCLTGRSGARNGLAVPQRTPEEAAGVLLGLLARHDLVLHEHFLLDEAGHSCDLPLAVQLLGELEAFFAALVEGLRPGDHLVICTDHGNVEALDRRQHTRNPVPLVAIGPAAEEARALRSLADVGPWVLSLAERGRR